MKSTYFLLTILLITLFSSINAQNFAYDIKYHRLDLSVNPAVRYISGEITTYFEPTISDFSNISFDLSDSLTVDSVKFHNQKLTFSHEKDFLTIDFPTIITALDSISVYYQGIPTENGFGSFITSTHNSVPIMWTLSEPMGAKTWWPCKQILSDKADSIDLYVTAPSEYKVAGNGLLISEKINGENKTTHWKHKYPITAYLVAFAVTNYESYYDYVYINDTLTIPILEYVYPEDLEEAKLETAKLPSALKYFSDTFMIYPFSNEKYGQAQFGWGGGMEHQTMTFLGGFDFSLMAHELAHQWFGDYITCSSWHDIWLNEGFAVYLEGLTTEQGLSETSWEQWKATTMYYATVYSSGSVYVDDTTSVSRIFDYYLTYMKGGMLLHMLRWTIGDDAFFATLRNYLNDPDLAFGYATVDDFKSHAETECNCDLTEFFNDWYYGQGYPKYTIDWNQDNDYNLTIKITQSQTHSSVDFFEMKLPIRLLGTNVDTVIIVENTYSPQIFTTNLDFKITDVIFDPDTWIVTKGSLVTQVASLEDIVSIKLKPNPANNNLNVEFNTQTFVDYYIIFDSNGNTIERKNIGKIVSEISIDTTVYNPGIYIIKIETNYGNYSRKFIKNND